MSHRSAMIQRCALATALVSLVGLTACEQPKWDDPAYISQQLAKKDPNMRTVALSKLEALKDDKKKAVIPALTKLYLEKDPNQKNVMKILVKLRAPEAKKAYMEEVKTNATDYAAAAAEALGDSKAKEAIPDMLATLEKTDNDGLKQGLLRGLQQMPDAQMVPTLTKILLLDADNNPIALHAYACEILGEVAQTTPQAFKPESVKALTRGIFLANKMRQNVSTQCGLAVQQLGKPAESELVSMFKGERKDVQSLMMAYKFPQNQPKGVAATRLTKLYAKDSAGPVFTETIKAVQEIPKSLRAKADQIAWIQMQIQLMQEVILGLGDLRVVGAKDVLVSLLNGDKNKDMSAILDYTSETLLRQNAATALNAIGDRSAAPALLDAAKKGLIKDLEKLAKIQEKKGQPMPGLQRYSFNVTSARMYALLAGADAEKGINELIAGAKGAVKKYYTSLLVMPKTFKECQKGDDKAKAACFGAKLKDKNTLVREKAAFELGRLSSAAAAPVLAQNLSIQSLDTREILTQQIYHHPSKAALSAVETLLKKEATRRDAAAKQDRYRLKMLRAWLKNNAK